LGGRPAHALDFALYPDALDAQVSRPNPTAGGITPQRT